MSGGSSSGGGSTTTQQSGPPPQVLQAYTNLTNAAANQAQQPLNLYSGPMVSGFTPQQQAGMQTIDNSQGIGVPYMNAAAQEFGQATQPLWDNLPHADTGFLGGYGLTALNNNAAYHGMALANATDAGGLAGTAPGHVAPYQQSASQGIGLPGYDTLPTYFNPYQQQVTQATQRLFDQQNAQQLEQVRGNAASQNAYGGDREGVAEALTAQQQQLAEAPTLAGIQQQGFAQAQQELNTQQQIQQQRQATERQLALGAGQLGLAGIQAGVQGRIGAGQLGLGAGQLNLAGAQQAYGEFNTQQAQQLAAEQANRWLASQAGFGMASLGTQAQNQALTGAQAEIGAGGMQQQLGQEMLNIPYQQFEATQAYPYQQLSFLAPIVEGTGSLAGGRSSTTSPGPSPISQIAGLGSAAAGLSGLFNGGGSSGSAAGGNPDTGDTSGFNSFFNAKTGGRIGFAQGGQPGQIGPTNQPGALGGIGAKVPNVNLDYIPTEEANPVGSRTGIGTGDLFQSGSKTSSGGGGGSSGLGGIGEAFGAAKTVGDAFAGDGILSGVGDALGALFLKTGGRPGFDDGGAPATPGAIPNPTSANPYGLPQVPKVDINHIIHPGPAVKIGEGPPKPVTAPQQQPQNMAADTKSLTDSAGKLTKMFNSVDESDSGSENSAGGGRIGLATGGYGGATANEGVPLGVAIQFGGSGQNIQGAYQQLLQLPLERLREMQIQSPPNTQQGQLIARVIASKQSTVGSGTAPANSPALSMQGGAGGLGMGQPLGGQQSPMGGGLGTASLGQQPQDYGGTSHLATGGEAEDKRGYVTEDELDPHPVVDHSGKSVVIRYPSEGKVLDLGLPPIRDGEERGSFAAGGATSPGPSAGFNLQDMGPNQVSIPLLTPQNSGSIFQNASTVAANNPGIQPGGGIGNWNVPMPQATQFGNGPGGSTTFPSSPAYMPNFGSAIMSGLQGKHLDPSQIPPVFGGTQVPGEVPMPGSNNGQPDSNEAIIAQFLGIQGGSGGNKEGGRIGFDQGGAAANDSFYPRLPGAGDAGAVKIHPQWGMHFLPGSGVTSWGRDDGMRPPTPANERKTGGRASFDDGGDTTEDSARNLDVAPGEPEVPTPPPSSGLSRRTDPHDDGPPPSSGLARVSDSHYQEAPPPSRRAHGRGTAPPETGIKESTDTFHPFAPPSEQIPIVPEWVSGGIGNRAKVVGGFDTPGFLKPNQTFQADIDEPPAPKTAFTGGIGEHKVDVTRALHDPAYRQQIMPDIVSPGAHPPMPPVQNESVVGPFWNPEYKQYVEQNVIPAGKRIASAYDTLTQPSSPEEEALSRGVPLEQVRAERNAKAARSAAIEPSFSQTMPPAGLGKPAQSVAASGAGIGIQAATAPVAAAQAAQSAPAIPPVTPPQVQAYRDQKRLGEIANPEPAMKPQPAAQPAAKPAAPARPAAQPSAASTGQTPAPPPQQTPAPQDSARNPPQVTGTGAPAAEVPSPEANLQNVGPGEPQRGSGFGSRYLNMGQMKQLLVDAGMPADKAPVGAAIMMAESSGDIFAKNEKGEHSYGLSQINADAHGDIAHSAYGNPQAAAQLMVKISNGGADFSPWSMYKNQTYRQYLGEAQGAKGAPVGRYTGVDPVVGPGTGAPGLEGDFHAGPNGQPQLDAKGQPQLTKQGEQKVEQIKRTQLSRTEPQYRNAMERWMNSPSYLLFLIGAGMLASRSPFPGVALGEGLQFAAKGAQGVASAEARADAARQRLDYSQQRIDDLEKNRSLTREMQANKFSWQQQKDTHTLELKEAELAKQIAVAGIAAQNHQASQEETKRYHDLEDQHRKTLVEIDKQRAESQFITNVPGYIIPRATANDRSTWIAAPETAEAKQGQADTWIRERASDITKADQNNLDPKKTPVTTQSALEQATRDYQSLPGHRQQQPAAQPPAPTLPANATGVVPYTGPAPGAQ